MVLIIVIFIITVLQ